MRLERGMNGIWAVLLLTLATSATAGVVSYQGRVELGGSPYSGPGYFKFAVVDAPGTTTSWSNDGTSVSGSEPTAGVTLSATNGLFDVLLGDTTLSNMTDLPASAFPNGSTRKLRVWFSSTNAAGSFTQLAPDRRVASVPYALQAERAERAANAGAVISFSSGVINPSTVSLFSPIVMGFGSSRVVPLGSDPVQQGQFAFTAPSNGVVERLQVSADVHFAPSASQGALVYTFAIQTSPGFSGATFPYSPTPVSAAVFLPAVTATTYPIGAYVTASGFIQLPFAVSAGDRLVLQVTSSMLAAPPALDQLGLQAALLFTPAP
ncbi:MAG: hypothetical protein ABIT01_14320 [Thermoanaerobaculia bacterium]